VIRSGEQIGVAAVVIEIGAAATSAVQHEAVRSGLSYILMYRLAWGKPSPPIDADVMSRRLTSSLFSVLDI